MQFLKSGILSTYQDSGRKGYCYSGINPNGAMDIIAVRLLNIILQNSEKEAAIEIHFPGPEIFFEKDTLIAIGGADFSPFLITDSKQIVEMNNWQCTWVSAGSILKFKKRSFGQRAYIAIKGGASVKEWLGSKSTNGLLDFNTIKANSQIDTQLFPKPDFFPYLAFSLLPPYSDSPIIRLIKGNEYDLLTHESKTLLENQPFGISLNSNRMGIRLEGVALNLENKLELISSAVDFGTVQLLPDGQLIILMADHQTTGGYPRLGNVVSVDLPILAQCGAQDTIQFRFISLSEAEELLILREKEIRKLKVTFSLLSGNSIK
ncbi:biotin-dependent carboxyltransferase family protein [Emticicia sp. BO119]|uniref:5-oxoprolinase subunit C family protein n=1 Tax=Emticicia sp. BO119 TaxID=2757768 RepID=UPI0015F0456B|nr:biotin-dependent carboxyltransferase family protein [Emticicia sp. BO119]MBA4849569.1 biotin-dependent carboxyltransferase [Emticicia sp. BO119]